MSEPVAPRDVVCNTTSVTTQTDLPSRRDAAFSAFVLAIATVVLGIGMFRDDWKSIVCMALFLPTTLYAVVLAVYAWKVAPR